MSRPERAASPTTVVTPKRDYGESSRGDLVNNTARDVKALPNLLPLVEDPELVAGTGED
jgi:hypothetical protein